MSHPFFAVNIASLPSAGVTFLDPVATDIVETVRPVAPDSEPEGLFQELFREQLQPPAATSWLPIISNTTKTEVRSGLKEELRSNLLLKYEPKDDLSFLGPPRLNKEILPNLPATALTRDKNQSSTQAQVGAALNALCSGLSELSKLDCLLTSADR